MRTILLLAALGLALPAAAQPAADAAAPPDDEAWRPTARGVHTLGGYVSGVYSRFDDGRSLTAAAVPRAGLFVTDGLLVELALGVTGSRYRSDGVDRTSLPTEVRSATVGGVFGPSVTKYFGPPDARVFPFVGASAGVSGTRVRTTVNGNEVDSGPRWDTSGEIRVGIMVPVARNFAIAAQVALPFYDTGGEDPYVPTTVLLSVGVATFLY